jgi:hypothetical protein
VGAINHPQNPTGVLGIDRALNSSGDDFDSGIDRCKSGFFPSVEDSIFEGGIFFDGFDGNEVIEETFISVNS